MAEARRFADLRYGHAGRLTYIPTNQLSNQSPCLHNSRLASSCPHFRTVGSSAELYPPSKSDLPEQTFSKISAERNLQRRWLLKAHPEAFMANNALPGLITEDLDRFRKLDDASRCQPLLCIGDMTDWSIPSKPVAASVLAVATGESGQLLRLARIDNSKWKWDDDKHSELHLSVIDPVDQDEEVVWASDGLPISQIKFVNITSRYDHVRWLIVQKQTSIVILQPGYTRVPHSQNRSALTSEHQSMSRIDPNPLLTLSHRETGGNAHSDFTFNPPADGKPYQICVIDECGYWTLWNILGKVGFQMNSLRLSLYRCGHVFEGPLTEIPLTPLYPAEQHGSLFVGTARGEDAWGDSFPEFEAENASTRARHLLLWNSEQFEVFDVVSGSSLPKIKEFVTAKSKFERILDVQISPVNQNHVFVLTAKFLLWIDMFRLEDESPSSYKSTILLTCPHESDHNGLKMSTGRTSGEDQADPMIFVYSSQGSQVSIFWFRLSQHALPEWHRQITTLPQANPNIQLLIFQPAKLTKSRLDGKGALYQRDGGQFYQGMILGRDLSVKYCMCYASENPFLSVTLPTTRTNWTKPDQHRRWRKKRMHILKHMGDYFVIPDAMTYLDKQLLGGQPNRDEENLVPVGDAVVHKPSPRPIKLALDRLARVVAECLDVTSAQRKIGIPAAVLDSIQEAIQHDKFALSTWSELYDLYETNGADVNIDANTEDALQSILSEANDQIVITQLGRGFANEPIDPMYSFSQLKVSLSDIWLEPLREKLSEESIRAREAWIAEIARDVFMATHGVVVQDITLFGDDTSLPNPPPCSQIQSSQPSSQKPPSGDETISRLRLLTSLSTSTQTKQATLLSYWPPQRGVDTKGYLSSVAVASERKFDDAKARLARIDSRRKALSDKYKRPAFMRGSQGASQVFPSSQQGQSFLSSQHPPTTPGFRNQSSQRQNSQFPPSTPGFRNQSSQRQFPPSTPALRTQNSNSFSQNQDRYSAQMSVPIMSQQGPVVSSQQVPDSSQSRGFWGSQVGGGKRKKVKKKSGFR